MAIQINRVELNPLKEKKDIGIYDLPERKRSSGSLFQAGMHVTKIGGQQLLKPCCHA